MKCSLGLKVKPLVLVESWALLTTSTDSLGTNYHGIWTKPKKKNPRLASGRKRVRQDIKINAANTSLRSQIPHRGEECGKSSDLSGDKAKATELFAKMQAVVDTVADKGIFHKNKAARDKSRLSTKVKALATAA
jgi:small subunit ribosomal protein S20